MNVPIVSIPESVYELTSRAPVARRASRTLQFINTLYRCGAVSMSAAYIIGLALRPLLDTLAKRRTEYIEHARKGLCLAYIRISHHVQNVPQVYQRGDRSYVDAGTSTDIPSTTNTLGVLAQRLESLANALQGGNNSKVECAPTITAARNLYRKCELEYFEVEPTFTENGRNLAQDIITEARLVKGCLVMGKNIR